MLALVCFIIVYSINSIILTLLRFESIGILQTKKELAL